MYNVWYKTFLCKLSSQSEFHSEDGKNKLASSCNFYHVLYYCRGCFCMWAGWEGLKPILICHNHISRSKLLESNDTNSDHRLGSGHGSGRYIYLQTKKFGDGFSYFEGIPNPWWSFFLEKLKPSFFSSVLKRGNWEILIDPDSPQFYYNYKRITGWTKCWRK